MCNVVTVYKRVYLQITTNTSCLQWGTHSNTNVFAIAQYGQNLMMFGKECFGKFKIANGASIIQTFSIISAFSSFCGGEIVGIKQRLRNTEVAAKKGILTSHRYDALNIVLIIAFAINLFTSGHKSVFGSTFHHLPKGILILMHSSVVKESLQ